MPLLKKLTPSLRINTILFFTLLLIAGGVAYYFFVHMPANEQRLVERHFRTLDRISENLSRKEQNTARFLYNNLKEILSDLPQAARTPENVSHEMQKRQALGSLAVGQVTALANWDWLWEGRYTLSFHTYFAKEQIQFTLYITVAGTHYQVAVFGDLRDYLQQSLANQDFENFLVVRGNEVVYQHNGGAVEILGDGKTDSLSSIGQSIYTHKRFPAKIGGAEKWLFVVPGNLYKTQKFGYSENGEGEGSDAKTYYIGIVDRVTFQREKLNISPLTIVILSFVIIGISLSLPFLKLQLLSPREQLDRKDAILIGIFLILGSSLVTLGLVNAYSYFGPEKTRIVSQLAELNRKVSDSFNGEIRNAINIIQQGTDVLAGDRAAVSQQKNNLPYNHLFWMDSTGMQRYKWSTHAVASPKINVGQRAYFRRIADESRWRMPLADTLSQPYFFETVLSWNSGESEGVVSIPVDKTVDGKKLVVAAVSFPLAPQQGSVVPRGFSYAILNTDGTTLFHQDSRRILQENFLEESNDNKTLRALLNVRGSGDLSVTYRGKSYKAYLAPLHNTDYMVITLLESSYFRSANTQVLIYTFTILLALSIFNVVLFVLHRIMISRASRVKAGDFSYHWLRPVPGAAGRYLQTVFVYLVIIALLLIFHDLERPFMNSFIFLLASVYAFLAGNLKAKDIYWRSKLSANAGRVLVVPGFFILALNGVAVLVGEGPLNIFVFQAVVITAFVLSERIAGKWKVDASYQYTYTAFVWLWLVIIGILPTMKVYEYTFTEEQKLSLKYRQLDIANQLMGNETTTTVFTSFFYDTTVEQYSDAYGTDEDKENLKVWMNRILGELRPLFDEYVLVSAQLEELDNPGSDTQWREEGDRLALHVRKPNGQLTRVHSRLFRYEYPQLVVAGKANPEAWMFWAVNLLLGVVLFLVILHVARRVFLLQTLGHRPLSRQQIRALITDTRHPYILLVGLPGSGKGAFLEEICKKLKQKATIVRVSEVVSADTSKEKFEAVAGAEAVFVIDELEYDLADPEQKTHTLEFLEKLLLLNPKKIVVSSAISPLKYLENYDPEEQKALIERWSAVFGRFYLTYFPLPQPGHERPVGVSLGLLYDECYHGHFLHQLYPSLAKWVETLETNGKQDSLREDIILQVQSLCELYYKSLWRQCTTDEKFVLFDLAQDNLVNPKSVKVINELLARGLVVNDGTVLRLMNQSFRNFVMTSISGDEAREIEDYAQRSGSWSRLRTPLLILLFTLSLFVFITQRGSFNAIIGAIPAFLAGLSVLQKFIQSIGSKEVVS